MNRPNPNEVFPNPNLPRLCFIKNVVKNPRIIIGDKFDAFKTINSDEKNRERLRAEGVATYAKKNGLSVTLYQDYGWPAKKLE